MVTPTVLLRVPTATVPKSTTFGLVLVSACAGVLNIIMQIRTATAPRIFVPTFVVVFMFVLVVSFWAALPYPAPASCWGWGGTINAGHVSSWRHRAATGEGTRFRPGKDRRPRTVDNLSCSVESSRGALMRGRVYTLRRMSLRSGDPPSPRLRRVR